MADAGAGPPGDPADTETTNPTDDVTSKNKEVPENVDPMIIPAQWQQPPRTPYEADFDLVTGGVLKDSETGEPRSPRVPPDQAGYDPETGEKTADYQPDTDQILPRVLPPRAKRNERLDCWEVLDRTDEVIYDKWPRGHLSQRDQKFGVPEPAENFRHTARGFVFKRVARPKWLELHGSRDESDQQLYDPNVEPPVEVFSDSGDVMDDSPNPDNVQQQKHLEIFDAIHKNFFGGIPHDDLSLLFVDDSFPRIRVHYPIGPRFRKRQLREFFTRVIEGELSRQWLVIRIFPGGQEAGEEANVIYLRDGWAIERPVPWRVGSFEPSRRVLRAMHADWLPRSAPLDDTYIQARSIHQAVQALWTILEMFFPVAVEQKRSFWFQVDRYKGHEYIKWEGHWEPSLFDPDNIEMDGHDREDADIVASRRSMRDDFLLKFLWRLDENVVNIYPSGRRCRETYEQFEERLAAHRQDHLMRTGKIQLPIHTSQQQTDETALEKEQRIGKIAAREAERAAQRKKRAAEREQRMKATAEEPQEKQPAQSEALQQQAQAEAEQKAKAEAEQKGKAEADQKAQAEAAKQAAELTKKQQAEALAKQQSDNTTNIPTEAQEERRRRQTDPRKYRPRLQDDVSSFEGICRLHKACRTNLDILGMQGRREHIRMHAKQICLRHTDCHAWLNYMNDEEYWNHSLMHLEWQGKLGKLQYCQYHVPELQEDWRVCQRDPECHAQLTAMSMKEVRWHDHMHTARRCKLNRYCSTPLDLLDSKQVLEHIQMHTLRGENSIDAATILEELESPGNFRLVASEAAADVDAGTHYHDDADDEMVQDDEAGTFRPVTPPGASNQGLGPQYGPKTTHKPSGTQIDPPVDSPVEPPEETPPESPPWSSSSSSPRPPSSTDTEAEHWESGWEAGTDSEDDTNMYEHCALCDAFLGYFKGKAAGKRRKHLNKCGQPGTKWKTYKGGKKRVD